MLLDASETKRRLHEDLVGTRACIVAVDVPDEVFRCLFDATDAVLGMCVPAHAFPIG